MSERVNISERFDAAMNAARLAVEREHLGQTESQKEQRERELAEQAKAEAEVRAKEERRLVVRAAGREFASRATAAGIPLLGELTWWEHHGTKMFSKGYHGIVRGPIACWIAREPVPAANPSDPYDFYGSPRGPGTTGIFVLEDGTVVRRQSYSLSSTDRQNPTPGELSGTQDMDPDEIINVLAGFLAEHEQVDGVSS